MLFTIINKNGVYIHKNEYHRYYYGFTSQISAKRINEYMIDIDGHIISTLDNNNEIQIVESELLKDIEWKISVGFNIHLYIDSNLTEYAMTIPKNTDIFIDERFYSHYQYIYKTGTYYFSCFSLDPLPIVPMKNILIGRIINQDGVIVRRGVENYSNVIGILSYNSFVLIQNKDFTKIPIQKNIRRLELYEKKGWINLYHHNISNIEWLGIYNNNFPCKMDIIPLNTSVFIKDEENIPENHLCIICYTNRIDTVFIHGNYGHNICCQNCSKKIKENECPLCKQNIDKIILLFESFVCT